MEDASIDDNFFHALALLHSTEDDSAEKLREMLDTYIERKYGFAKTLIARMPKKFFQNTKTHETASIDEISKMDEDLKQETRGNELSGSLSTENVPLDISNVAESGLYPVTIFDTEFEDYTEKEEIPRISIPDEGSADGLLCKICNGAKLGPLILLECQECQDVYHPLCHQPPVVDIDVYDPRIVWRCRNCIETSSEISSVMPFDETKLKTYRRVKDSSKMDTTFTKVNRSKKMDLNFQKSLTNFEDDDSVDRAQKSSSHDSIAKDSTSTTQRSVKGSSSQLKKRIGSKLSVTRNATK